MLEAGQKAPAVESITLPETKVLLVFFKVSCPTCQLTLPFLERLHRSGRLPIFGISQDGPKATGDFTKAFGLTFPTVMDSAADRYPASNAFEITNVPSLFLVGQNRTIEWSAEGFSRRELEDLGSSVDAAVFRAGERVPEFKPG
ncbi:MAG: TlpA disulfide reductase family protein [Bryobacteraceae bacterium]